MHALGTGLCQGLNSRRMRHPVQRHLRRWLPNLRTWYVQRRLQMNFQHQKCCAKRCGVYYQEKNQPRKCLLGWHWLLNDHVDVRVKLAFISVLIKTCTTPWHNFSSFWAAAEKADVLVGELFHVSVIRFSGAKDKGNEKYGTGRDSAHPFLLTVRVFGCAKSYFCKRKQVHGWASALKNSKEHSVVRGGWLPFNKKNVTWENRRLYWKDHQ